MRVKMMVAYDGTNYKGWQIQPNGITIEEVLNRELCALLREPILVVAGEPHRFRRSFPGECGGF